MGDGDVGDATAGGNFGGEATSNAGISGDGTGVGTSFGDSLNFDMQSLDPAMSWGNLDQGLSMESNNPFGNVDFSNQTQDNGFLGKLAALHSTIMGNPFGKAGMMALSMANPALGGILGIAGLGLAGAQGKGGQAMGNAFGNAIQGLTGPVGQGLGALGFGLGPAMGTAFSGVNSPTSDGSNAFSGDNQGGGTNWGTLANGLGGLAGLYSLYSQGKQTDGYLGSLQSMYGSNSPYAATLRQELNRRDAAAGRRSQYGPREVELQAALAKAASGVAPSIMQGQQNQFNNRVRLAQMFMNGMGKDGFLSNMFSAGSQNTPTYTPVEYGANTELLPNSFDFSGGFNG